MRIRTEEDKRELMAFVADIEPSIEKPMTAQFEEWKESRRAGQRRLYWHWVGVVAKDQGNTSDYVHAHSKLTILQPFLLTIERHHKRASFDQELLDTATKHSHKLALAFSRLTTTILSVAEMSEFLGMFQLYYSMNGGVVLQDPQERQCK